MVGNALDRSTGPPDYRPLWNDSITWMFSAQYFMEIHNVTSNATEGHAATGEVFDCVAGEQLWTEFTLSEHWVWNLSMGVVGDTSRTSTVISAIPYMGLLGDEADSWEMDVFDHANVNSCWELYGTEDRDHYPSSGST